MLNLALFQFRPILGDVDRNLALVLEAIKHVRGDSIILLPEMWQCGFDYQNIQKHAEATMDVLEELKRVSEEKELTIVGTYPLKGEKGLYNSAVLVEKGRIVGIKRKIKLFPLYEEHKHFLPGSENPAFNVHGIKTAVIICFELRFPHLFSDIREAQVILSPSMWGSRRGEHLRVISRARAIENQCFLALSNAWGLVGAEEYAGSSSVYSPWGDVLAYSEKGDCLLQVMVDLEEVEVARRLLPIRD
ncbi:MAG: carbon-nitrogen hydrolase family protein [Aquificaceae bacterium]|nr:carbon-nitrogen hydrolase family protein [Aquificaceae bacterium]